MDYSCDFEELVERVSLQQAERLAFIDFKIKYLGEVSRNDIIDEFKVGQATASNDLKIYRGFRPENTQRDNASKKTVVLLDSYIPLVKIDVHIALNFILHGFCRNELMFKAPSIPAESINLLMVKDLISDEDVAAVTRAIHSKTALRCFYLSSSSDNHDERLLFPTAVFVDRQYWYFRAYDRNSESVNAGFKNFKMARIRSAKNLSDIKPAQNEELAKDEGWHTLIPMQIAVHSTCKNGASLEREFGLTDGKKTIVCKAAFAYFVRQNWRIDVGNGRQSYFNFSLENSESLRQIDCARGLFQ